MVSSVIRIATYLIYILYRAPCETTSQASTGFT